MFAVRVSRKLDGNFYWELLSDGHVVDKSPPFELAADCIRAGQALGVPMIGVGGSKARHFAVVEAVAN